MTDAFAWPDPDAFEEVEAQPKPGPTLKADVVLSVTLPKATGTRVTVTLSPVAMDKLGVKVLDRFKVHLAPLEKGVVCRLTPHHEGGAQLQNTPGKRTPNAASPCLLHLGRYLSGCELGFFDRAEPRHQFLEKSPSHPPHALQIYIPGPVKANPFAARNMPDPDDSLPGQLARKWLRAGQSPEQVRKRLDEDQNVIVDLEWVKAAGEA